MLASRSILRTQSLRTSGAARRAAVAAIKALPAYRVALWPDGWVLEPDGAVRVVDTHAMAEARRWFEMAGRAGGSSRRRPLTAAEQRRAMRLLGVYVPPAVVALSGQRFPSEQVASVALQLVAGDWIGERRQRLLAQPERALSEHARAWRGSRHQCPADAEAAVALLRQALDACIAEGLVPPARYRLISRCEDGFGLRRWRCAVEVNLDPYARARARDALSTALIPWNRAVIRDGMPMPLITLDVRAATGHRVG
ncbi:MAG: hypothetical protein LJE69_09495 [Thiohalocapsa sp.]|jgi:hypothetical protein|uniref:hypothetical protein n=1 Tax=Thiohalocapsa sp. TaxID=2497641 RepID=UPI0025D76617|nr:hypothetical protein [Thiohalocapsa sp.]MCG6941472.1 hypothetical protein [Thiohalocapsa sp.]